MALPLILVAACALIDSDGRVLIAQRPEGKTMAGLWEFPGGKIEAGERPEETVIREMREELGVTIKEPCLAPLIFASHAYADFHLLMPLFLCRRWEGIPQPQEAQKIAWVRPKDLALDSARYPMPPADLPLIPLLRDLL
ncbi:MAG TPA: (deoxy)nucleoside triphosphate pyrophosphohydrolase [Micropepsaceae bacterium]|nr:(deoxy)nucleoside triphosphate pyrophosphohydrolase [Micropepsaceae bacterium]